MNNNTLARNLTFGAATFGATAGTGADASLSMHMSAADTAHLSVVNLLLTWAASAKGVLATFQAMVVVTREGDGASQDCR
jgi:hypothetical protein